VGERAVGRRIKGGGQYRWGIKNERVTRWIENKWFRKTLLFHSRRMVNWSQQIEGIDLNLRGGAWFEGAEDPKGRSSELGK